MGCVSHEGRADKQYNTNRDHEITYQGGAGGGQIQLGVRMRARENRLWNMIHYVILFVAAHNLNV